ncbi:hypothetical protein QBC43DRAFT_322204 [Cladorrhinum sp. PSN259]|nr:hypothetical protein QBC43DRAFT_322204 [Cladorrhinum sp. PSN259]
MLFLFFSFFSFVSNPPCLVGLQFDAVEKRKNNGRKMGCYFPKNMTPVDSIILWLAFFFLFLLTEYGTKTIERILSRDGIIESYRYSGNTKWNSLFPDISSHPNFLFLALRSVRSVGVGS